MKQQMHGKLESWLLDKTWVAYLLSGGDGHASVNILRAGA